MPILNLTSKNKPLRIHGLWKTLLISIFFITSCSGLNIKTADRSNKGGGEKPIEASVDQTEIITEKKTEVYNIAVIIGPGGAKAISASGVLKILASEDLNIKYMTGLGWGALPAAVYANNLKPHELEWQFYKLKQTSLRAKNFMGSTKDYLDPKKVESYFEQIFSSKKIQDFKLAFACPVRLEGSKSTTIRLSDSSVKGLMMCVDLPPLFERRSYHTAAPMSYGSMAEHFESKDINFIVYIDSLSGTKIDEISKEKLSSKDRATWERILKLNKHFSEHSDFAFKIDTKAFGLFSFDKASGLVGQGDMAGKEQFRALERKLRN